MMRKALILFLLFVSSWALAQPYTSALGRFRVDEKKGCVPFTVTAESLVSCSGACAYDFLGDGVGSSADDFITGTTASFTYTLPGKFKLKFCNANNCSTFDEIEIEVVANAPPAFDLYTCSANGVQVKITDTQYNQYVISYSDGGTLTVPVGSLAKDTHTFATAGGKTVSVKGRNLNAADNCTTAIENFTALASLPLPSLTSLTSLHLSEIELNYTLATHVLGRIDIAANNNSTFQQIKSVYDDARDTIKNVANETSYYCFRIGSIDACSNTVSYSSPVCSMVFTATAMDSFNQLDWVNNAGFITSYTLKRDNAVYIGGISNSATTRNDDDALCNVEHCYQLVANYSFGAVSTSLIKCANSFTTQKPPVLSDLTATFNIAGSIELSWEETLEAVQYSIFKNIKGGSYSFAANQNSSPYVDAQFSLPSPSCYEVLYSDACNNVSDVSLEACPVVLTAAVSKENIVSLSWSAYTGWQNGVASYRLEKYSTSGGLLRSYALGAATSYIDEESDVSNQVTFYKVIITSNTPGIGPVNSNTIEVIRRPNLFYATAFTPDKTGPAENETFKVYGQYVADFEMKIFNRWGELMYTVNDFDKGWNGTFRGVDQPDGTYAFIATITDFAGRTSTQSGSLVLLRKK